MKQALSNLVGNAIKYTPTDGTVSPGVVSDKYTVWVHVQDNGYRIPANDLPNIFDRFYRVHEVHLNDIKDNGLGLAIVKSAIEAHKGQINVEGEISKGTCFTLFLPLVSAMTAQKQDAQHVP